MTMSSASKYLLSQFLIIGDPNLKSQYLWTMKPHSTSILQILLSVRLFSSTLGMQYMQDNSLCCFKPMNVCVTYLVLSLIQRGKQMILYVLNFLSLSFIGDSIQAKYSFVMIDEYWQICLRTDPHISNVFPLCSILCSGHYMLTSIFRESN